METTQADLVRLETVTKHYEATAGVASVPVLNQLTLTVRRGETLGIIGPSGSGKSTLLNIIGTLDHPDSGRVLLEGLDLTEMDARRLAAVRSQSIGFVFQAHYLLPQCSVLENVLIPTLAVRASNPKPEVTDRARRLLDRVGLSARTNHRPSQLSGGECQRVAVVRALINSPTLLLADEPTGALDHTSARQLGQLLLDLNTSEHTTLIVVTHARELAHRMERVLELCEGRLVPVSSATQSASGSH